MGKTTVYFNDSVLSLLINYSDIFGGQSQTIAYIVQMYDCIINTEKITVHELFDKNELEFLGAVIQPCSPYAVQNHVYATLLGTKKQVFEQYEVDREKLIDKIKKMSLSEKFALINVIIGAKNQEEEKEIMNHNEPVKKEDWMEVSDNGLWIVDELIEDPHFPRGYIVRVGKNYYKVENHKVELVKYKPCDEYYRAEYNHEFFIRGVEPRGGFKKPEVRRAITDDEFDELKSRFGLTEDDISDEFELELGATFGPKAAVKVTVRQIQLPNDKAVSLEAELRDIGIYAGNGSAGRLNIRIK